MRQVHVYRNQQLAGRLTETDDRTYIFRYEDAYFQDPQQPPVSLTLPKTQQEYHSDHLFPFFFNMLAEGANRQLQCRQLKIDERDSFGLLMHTAQIDTIGAVTVKPAHEN